MDLLIAVGQLKRGKQSQLDFLAGPEGFNRKNFEISTQYNQKSGPRGFEPCM
jgi:hypothetical protein